jgi:murein DD-endopeptidase MepM/ murein hydrolase activator NlpD
MKTGNASTRNCLSVIVILTTLVIQGCQLAAMPAGVLPVKSSSLPDILETSHPVAASLPTSQAAVEVTVIPEIQSSHAPEPLRFTFPTAGSDPVSHWRPPLYPIPWEPTPNDHFYFMRPIGANEVNWPLAKYRYGGVFFADTVHTGVDIPTPIGTPVMAAASGKVIWAGYGLFFLREELQDPYGLAVAIEHDFGYNGEAIYTVYGHMDKLYTFRGQEVEAGQVIGLSGETGNVTGPHLHFEVRLKDNRTYGSRNPELWIAPPQGWGVLAGRVMGDTGELKDKETVHLRNIDTNQHWSVITYGKGGVNTDPYYNENMVIGDLPAGNYRLWIDHNNTSYSTKFEIKPGMVTFFKFAGKMGFKVGPPPTPAPDFVPPDATATPTQES